MPSDQPSITTGERWLLAALALVVAASWTTWWLLQEPPTVLEQRHQPLPPAKIDINNATIDALMLLPGVGQATAADIIRDRNANGPFSDLDNLSQRVPALKKHLQDLIPLVSFEEPADR